MYVGRAEGDSTDATRNLLGSSSYWFVAVSLLNNRPKVASEQSLVPDLIMDFVIVYNK